MKKVVTKYDVVPADELPEEKRRIHTITFK